MMTLKRLAIVLSVLLACLPFATKSEAATAAHGGFRQGYELYPYLTFVTFDDKAHLEDDIGFGFRFGWLFTPNHELDFMFNWVSANDDTFPEWVDLSHFQAAYVYNFTSHGVVPYFTAGLGFAHWDDSSPALGSETNNVLGVGGGLRLFMGQVAYARFEWRHNFFQGNGDVFADGKDFDFDEFAFGVGWRFPSY